ncbi:hypothetical protein BS78_05G088700 [Paspalum vaginatum]|nr:hypothetical protein BS78_05G088700 [Paspalum vaginatum]
MQHNEIVLASSDSEAQLPARPRRRRFGLAAAWPTVFDLKQRQQNCWAFPVDHLLQRAGLVRFVGAAAQPHRRLFRILSPAAGDGSPCGQAPPRLPRSIPREGSGSLFGDGIYRRWPNQSHFTFLEEKPEEDAVRVPNPRSFRAARETPCPPASSQATPATRRAAEVSGRPPSAGVSQITLRQAESITSGSTIRSVKTIHGRPARHQRHGGPAVPLMVRPCAASVLAAPPTPSSSPLLSQSYQSSFSSFLHHLLSSHLRWTQIDGVLFFSCTICSPLTFAGHRSTEVWSNLVKSTHHLP